MQNFIDTVTNELWAFDDDVQATQSEGGVYAFAASDGTRLEMPSTLEPNVLDAPTGEQLLAEAKTVQIAWANASCGLAISQGSAPWF